MKRRARATGGYSLLEVVVATAMIGLFSLGVCASYSASIRMNGRTQAMLEEELQEKREAAEKLSALDTVLGELMEIGIDVSKLGSDLSYAEGSIDVDLTDSSYYTDYFKSLGIDISSDVIVQVKVNAAMDPLTGEQIRKDPSYQVTVADKDDEDISITTWIKGSVIP